MNQLNVIHHADCEKEGGLCTIEDASVNVILCDLPYGSTNCDWDTPLDLVNIIWPQYKRILKPKGVILLFATQPFSSVLVSTNLAMYHDRWVWIKNKATGHLNANRMPLNVSEDILVFSHGYPGTYNPQLTQGHKGVNQARNRTQSKIYRAHTDTKTDSGRTTRSPLDVLYCAEELDPRALHFNVVNNDDPQRTNSTQKPVPLCRYLLRTYTNPGDVVLDNCIGSGTTAIACIEEGFDYIGFEKRGDQCAAARERVARHVRPALFDGLPSKNTQLLTA